MMSLKVIDIPQALPFINLGRAWGQG